MTTRLHYRGYSVATSLPDPAAKELMDSFLDNSYEKIKIIKDNKHNFVAQAQTPSLPNVIVKQPRKRNSRRWERFLTLFRPGEAVRIYNSHLKLLELGFNCPEPLLAAEQQRAGMVRDSVVAYRFQEGRSARGEDTELVSYELQRLHQKGYTRGDPKALNFIVHDGSVYFIDFKLARPSWFRKHSIRMEYAHFLHTMPEGIRYLPPKEQHSPGFLFAAWLRRTVSNLKKKKRIWRETTQNRTRKLKITRRAVWVIVGAIFMYQAFLST
ncbi:lipopolysaccharide core heptose(II) kinase RfaY [Marinobacter litoralis]|uniref:lipopolysaccharide core heptose(II) kinase RfaY n=1 Tax=Marinobacter litoralis TaxID=187981 RepID=UPI0018ECF353|nr:lipopolysaccharide core heptose(II) kinase RfaY [Marinobacter litoralis]MBJ6138732.1 hypothetical protein [Marinobacter litoralis]